MNNENNTIKIGKSDTQFSILRFLCEAASTDTTRDNMYQRIHVETENGLNTLVATDGLRLHTLVMTKYTLSVITDGDYTIIRNTATGIELSKETHDNTKFPEWRRVVPPKDVILFEELSFDTYNPANDRQTSSLPQSVYNLNRLGVLINPKYLKPLGDYEKATLRGCKYGWEATAGVKSKLGDGAVTFTLNRIFHTISATIMPMRNDGNGAAEKA